LILSKKTWLSKCLVICLSICLCLSVFGQVSIASATDDGFLDIEAYDEPIDVVPADEDTKEARDIETTDALPAYSDASVFNTGVPYRDYLAGGGYSDAPAGIEIPMDADSIDAAGKNANDSDKPGGEIDIKEGEGITLVVDVKEPGYYHIAYDYFTVGNGLIDAEGRWFQNGEQPFEEMQRVTFPVRWQSVLKEFARDRYDSEIPSMQEKVDEWQSTMVSDSANLEAEPLRFYCDSGVNTFRLEIYTGEIRFKDFRLVSPDPRPDYKSYRKSIAEAPGADVPDVTGVSITMQAEKPDYKNSTMVVPVWDKSYDAIPYETLTKPINVIDESTWILAGDALYYKFSVPKDGWYKIAFKYKQTDKPNVRVFRSIKLDGELPFTELRGYAFDYYRSHKFSINTLHGEDGDYEFYLTAGEHELSIAVESSQYADIIQRLKKVDTQISSMYIDLKKVAGREADKTRDWKLGDHFPDMEKDLKYIRNELNDISDELIQINNGEKNSDQQSFVTLALKSLDGLLKKPNDIPKKTAQFTEGSGSISQLVAKGISDINMQAMCLDEVYVFSPDSPPQYRQVGIGKRAVEWSKRFLNTFSRMKDAGAATDGAVTLNIWVNRGRSYVNAIQRITDTEFTPKTGIHVNYYILSDEASEEKLKMAVASGADLDAALAVSYDMPFELGIRGALLDLRTCEGFGETAKSFPPGVFLALAADESIYGLPDLLTFHVTFYRKDILESLNIEIPETWDDVEKLMPELQRYGMNYYTPMASGAGEKLIADTAPFIMQNGGSLYTGDGMGADLNSEKTTEAIMRMCDLYTKYGLSLQVNSFFESFRSGITPLGVGTAPNYFEMMIAAPELKGNWGIALPPGTMGEDGKVHREYACLGTANVIFKQSKHPKETWEFLQWWMSDDIQREFCLRLVSTYGKEYFNTSANLAAFALSPMPEPDKKIVLESWESMKDVQYVPGWYLVEREISNTWNAVVFDRNIPRVRIDRAQVLSNREISRRMEEFGYVKNGKMVKPYPVYAVDDMKRWFDEDGRGG